MSLTTAVARAKLDSLVMRLLARCSLDMLADSEMPSILLGMDQKAQSESLLVASESTAWSCEGITDLRSHQML